MGSGSAEVGVWVENQLQETQKINQYLRHFEVKRASLGKRAVWYVSK